MSSGDVVNCATKTVRTTFGSKHTVPILNSPASPTSSQKLRSARASGAELMPASPTRVYLW